MHGTGTCIGPGILLLERAYERWLPPNLSSHYCLEWDRSCELEDIHRRLEYCFCFGKLFGWNSCNICHLKPLTTMISAWTLKCHITQLSAKAILQILQTSVIEHVQLSISICSWCRQAGAFVVIEWSVRFPRCRQHHSLGSHS